MNKLSHIDIKGDARMVDVGEKTNTKRHAMAAGSVSMKSETLRIMITCSKFSSATLIAPTSHETECNAPPSSNNPSNGVK